MARGVGPATVRYKIPSGAYPRFEFLLSRLQDIVTRLERLIAQGSLATCISQGKVKLMAIVEPTAWLKREVAVSVPQNVPIDLTLDLHVKYSAVTEQGIVKETKEMESETVLWSTFLKDMEAETKFHPHLVIYPVESPFAEELQGIVEKFPIRENVIIYDNGTKTNYSFQDLLGASYDTQSVKLDPRNSHIYQQIQYLLEDRVVEVLENIVHFASMFAPKPGVEMTETLLHQCSREVVTSLKCQYVVDDLDPDKVPVVDDLDPDKVPIADVLQHHKALEQNYSKLIEVIDPVPLMDRMMEIEFVSRIQLQDIQEISTTSMKNRQILQVVRSRGPDDFKKFLDMLKETGNKTAYELLTSGKSSSKY